MPHIVLLGDSVFDNAPYTGRAPDVTAHLRGMLPSGWGVTRLAVDGASTSGLARQAARIPRDATHLVVSVGGNDALGNIDLLSAPARSTADALALLGARVRSFESAYRAAITPLATRALSLTLCTIYNGNLADRDQATLARIALMIFNDAILGVAFEHAAGVIDLRLVCSDPADYANPIEPSGEGGCKIARAIARVTGAMDRGTAATVVW